MRFAVLVAVLATLAVFIAARHVPHLHAHHDALNGRGHHHDHHGKVGHSDVHYKYDAKRTNRAVHQLDDLSTYLAEWDCNGKSLALRFRSAQVAASLNVNEGDIITGTSSWQCEQTLGEQLILIVEAATIKGDTFHALTSPGKLSDMFESIDLTLEASEGLHAVETSFNANQYQSRYTHETIGNRIGSNEQDDEHAAAHFSLSRSVHQTKSSMLLLLSPTGAEYFTLGDTITVSWKSNYTSGPFLVELVRDAFPLANQRVYFSVNSSTISDASIDIGVTSVMPGSRWYFIRITPACANKPCPTVISDYITVNEDPDLVLTSPHQQDVYLPGDFVEVHWNYNPKIARFQFNGNVAIFTIGPDGKHRLITSKMAPLVSGGIPLTLPTTGLVSSSWYYSIINWNCTYWGPKQVCEQEHSPYFTVRTTVSKEVDIVVVQPEQGVFFMPGQSLDVAWAGVSDQKIEVTLKRERFGLDAVVRKYSVGGSQQALHIPIDSTFPSDSGYYINIEYGCKLGVLGFKAICHSAESPRFSVNVKPVFQFSDPSTNDITYSSLPATFPVTWKAVSAFNGTARLRLMQAIPMWFDLQVSGQDYQNIPASGSKSITLANGSPFPLYWKLTYNCNFLDMGCQNAYSKPFNVISEQSIPWNYNPSTKTAVKSVQLIDWSCAACSGSPAPPPQFCTLCNANRSTSVSVSCPNCWVNAAVKLYKLQFVMSGITIQAMAYDLKGVITANADLRVEMAGTMQLAVKKQLWSTPLAGVVVSVAGIKISFGLILDIKTPNSFNANGALTATAGFDGVLTIASSLQYGSRYPANLWKNNASVSALNLHAPTLVANATIRVQSGLEARLRATLLTEQVFTASASASGILDLNVGVKNPPYPPKPTGSGPICAKNHRAEWNLDFYVNGAGQVNFGSYNKESPETEYYRKPLANGCLLPA